MGRNGKSVYLLPCNPCSLYPSCVHSKEGCSLRSTMSFLNFLWLFLLLIAVLSEMSELL